MNLTGKTVTLDLELVDPDGNVLATVVQTRPEQFPTMPAAL